MHAPIEIRPADSGTSPGTELITAMLAELDALYGKRPGPRPTATPEELSAPHGGFFIAWRRGNPAGCGGFKRLTDDLAEVKRIYVLPRYRSRGYAALILSHVEEAAAAAGFTRVRLQHGADQPHAQALYLGAGYTTIPDYNGNPYAAHWAEKQLTPR